MSDLFSGDVLHISRTVGARGDRDAPLVVWGSTLANPSWPDVTTNSVGLLAKIPWDYVSGDITLRLFRRASVGANTAVMRRDAYRFRDATAFATIETATNINFTPGDTNTHLLTWTIAAANVLSGDMFRFDISRLGGDASDTLAGTVDYDGAWFEYYGGFSVPQN